MASEEKKKGMSADREGVSSHPTEKTNLLKVFYEKITLCKEWGRGKMESLKWQQVISIMQLKEEMERIKIK